MRLLAGPCRQKRPKANALSGARRWSSDNAIPARGQTRYRRRDQTAAYGGRSVFGWEPIPGQLRSG
jgi:hypothetical protein